MAEKFYWVTWTDSMIRKALVKAASKKSAASQVENGDVFDSSNVKEIKAEFGEILVVEIAKEI